MGYGYKQEEVFIKVKPQDKIVVVKNIKNGVTIKIQSYPKIRCLNNPLRYHGGDPH